MHTIAKIKSDHKWKKKKRAKMHLSEKNYKNKKNVTGK